MLSLRKIRAYARSHTGAAWFVEFDQMLLGAFLGYMVSGTFLDVAYFDLFYQLVAAVIIAKELLMKAISVPKTIPTSRSTPGVEPWAAKIAGQAPS